MCSQAPSHEREWNGIFGGFHVGSVLIMLIKYTEVILIPKYHLNPKDHKSVTRLHSCVGWDG